MRLKQEKQRLILPLLVLQVVMSMETFENMQFESEIYCKLQDAEKQSVLTGKCFSSKEVFKELQKITAE